MIPRSRIAAHDPRIIWARRTSLRMSSPGRDPGASAFENDRH
jgi:hypothetical protein